MDEQFKSLKFDMDEDIEERRRAIKRRHGRKPIKIGHAIILGAIIIGGIFFGGQFYLSHLKTARVENVVLDTSENLKSKNRVNNPLAKTLAEKLSGTDIDQGLNMLGTDKPKN
jgi:O-acetyl-ADP-ribose deacetylase (regulator of RNase III)